MTENCTREGCNNVAKWEFVLPLDWFGLKNRDNYEKFREYAPKFCDECAEWTVDHEGTRGTRWRFYE